MEKTYFVLAWQQQKIILTTDSLKEAREKARELDGDGEDYYIYRAKEITY